jgi:hypothetical protein
VEERGTPTVGIPHKTRGHALVFAAVCAKGDRYPATSWSLARPVGVLYALQKAAKAMPKKKWSAEFGAGVFAGRHTSVFKTEPFRPLSSLQV